MTYSEEVRGGQLLQWRVNCEIRSVKSAVVVVDVPAGFSIRARTIW
jgi:hypothetical protein